MIRLAFLLSLTLATTLTQAQDSAFAHLNAGLLYNSGLNYYGRVDSLQSKGICPFLGISLKNGLYVNSTFVFIENSLQSQYAATLLEAGYNFTGSKKHWAGNLSVSRFLYQPDIVLVESAVKEMASAGITRLSDIANISLTGSVRRSDQLDYNVQAGLDHIIRIPGVIGDRSVLVLDPTATLSAGTQNFTTTYLQEKHFLLFPTEEEQITATSKQFNILAWEISCPVILGAGKWKWMLTPSYILPKHVLQGEIASPLFYATAMVKLTL